MTNSPPPSLLKPTPPNSEPDSDFALISRFCKGDTPALGLLANRYESALLGLARGILNHDLSLAADAVQETWVRVIRHARYFDHRSSFKTWVYRILINRALDMRSRRRFLSLAADDHSGTPSAPNSPARSHPAADVLDDEQALLLRQALSELSDSARLIILLCTHRGLTQAQAAEVLDIPIGTLKSRHSAALRQLRLAMGLEPAPSEQHA